MTPEQVNQHSQRQRAKSTAGWVRTRPKPISGSTSPSCGTCVATRGL